MECSFPLVCPSLFGEADEPEDGSLTSILGEQPAPAVTSV